jgi:nucleoside-diphosphate-sugar epimerase
MIAKACGLLKRSMSRTIAITGVTGFIGSVLAKRLTSLDWRIRALVRPGSIHKKPNDQALEWVVGDLEDMESLRRLVYGAEAIVHCAGAVRGGSQANFEHINVDGVARMVRAATEQRPKPRFILISSLAARQPHLSYYAASKQKGEKILVSKADQMPWTIFRPSAVYGPEDRELLPLFKWMLRGIAPVIGCPKNRASLLYVEDLAEAIACCLQLDMRSGCCYELHDGHTGGYRWKDVIDTVARIRGKPIIRISIPAPFLNLAATFNVGLARFSRRAPMLTPGKIRELLHPDWVADNRALTNDTGWIPRVLLEEGLRRTLGKATLQQDYKVTD